MQHTEFSSSRSAGVRALVFVWHPKFNATVPDTFVDVRGESTHKHLARVAFHALPVLVRKVRGAQAAQALVAALVVRETVLHGEEGGVA